MVGTKTELAKSPKENIQSASVAANFCCEVISVYNRKGIGFEGEGDKLLSLADSTSNPFIPLFMWLFRGKLDLVCILNVYITRLLNWSLMLFSCSKSGVSYIIIEWAQLENSRWEIYLIFFIIRLSKQPVAAKNNTFPGDRNLCKFTRWFLRQK